MVVALIWNPRGLNRPDKLIRVHDLVGDSPTAKVSKNGVNDLITETCLDIICFSESKKEDFYRYTTQTVGSQWEVFLELASS